MGEHLPGFRQRRRSRPLPGERVRHGRQSADRRVRHRPSVFFVGNGDGTFSERAAELGVADTDQGRGVVAFDYDSRRRPRPLRPQQRRPGTTVSQRRRQRGPLARRRAPGPHAEHRGDRGADTKSPRTASPRCASCALAATTPRRIPPWRTSASAPRGSVTVEVLWPDGSRSIRERVSADQRLVIDQPPPGSDEQMQQQRDCILALNAAGARLGKIVGKRFVGCVANATAGDAPSGHHRPGLSRRRSGGTRRGRGGPHGGRGCGEVSAGAHVRSRRCRGSERRHGGRRSARRTCSGPTSTRRWAPPPIPPPHAARWKPPGPCRRSSPAKVKAFNACKASAAAGAALIRSVADLAACHATMTGTKVVQVVAKAQQAAREALRRRRPRGRLARTLRWRGIDGTRDLPRRAGRVQHLHGARRRRPSRNDMPSLRRTASRRCTAATARSPSSRSPGNGTSCSSTPSGATRRDRRCMRATCTTSRERCGTRGARMAAGELPGMRTSRMPRSIPPRDRAVAISFAAYRLLAHRFSAGPGAAATQAGAAREDVRARLRRRLYVDGRRHAGRGGQSNRRRGRSPSV